MARRRGRGDRPAGRGKKDEAPDYYARSESDVGFIEKSHQRVKAKVRRQWITRLIVLALLALAAYIWGPGLIGQARSQGGQTAEELQGVGRHIREGVDRRSGAGLDETTP